MSDCGSEFRNTDFLSFYVGIVASVRLYNHEKGKICICTAYLIIYRLVLIYTGTKFPWSWRAIKLIWYVYSSPEPSVGICRPYSSNIFSSETTVPVEANFHTEPPWDGGMKVCWNRHGHMTEMATIPVYGKNPLKIFSETSRPMTFEPGIKHWGLGPYKICSNDNPGLTLTYFTARSTLLSNAFL